MSIAKPTALSTPRGWDPRPADASVERGHDTASACRAKQRAARATRTVLRSTVSGGAVYLGYLVARLTQTASATVNAAPQGGGASVSR